MDEKRSAELAVLQTELGYTFGDAELLNTALTHTSYVKGDGKARQHNERLEFLGDAVLELCVSEYLYHSFPDMDEGMMTRVRSMAVYEPALHQVAVEKGLGARLLLSHGEENSGGREKPSILADAMEAVIGAVYLDGGLAAASDFIFRNAMSAMQNAVKGMSSKDYKTMLQEYVQKQHIGSISYKLADSHGPDHKKTFVIQAALGERVLGTGEGGSKQEAGQRAAKAALHELGQLGESAD